MQAYASVFHGWPAWTLRRDDVALQIVPAVGGRLMGIEYGGSELCFINPQLAGQLASDDAQHWSRLCGDWSFPLWGGGKTWVAPEAEWPDGNPQRDLDSGPYRVVDRWSDEQSCGVELESPICRQSGLQIRRRIVMRAGTAGWSVEQTLINAGERSLRCGIWDVLMLRRPALVEVMLDAPRSGMANAACREIAGKGEVADLRRRGIVVVGDDSVRVHCREAQQYKLGFSGASGEIRVRLDLPEGRFDYRRSSPAPNDAVYAHGHPIEVFNAPDLPYFEVESHSPLATLAPHDRLSLSVSESVTPSPATT